jgi:hypothetical protein
MAAQVLKDILYQQPALKLGKDASGLRPQAHRVMAKAEVLDSFPSLLSQASLRIPFRPIFKVLKMQKLSRLPTTRVLMFSSQMYFRNKSSITKRFEIS